ncbi:hypothetical protein BGZ96_002556 [Linnemannia gamsii]|uniref:DNA replication regulator Sld3 C-terminal domain-containing protein n=1 Tax=Linnemannia gamsii TaxID=64522 RepID=A0ABQ7K8N4_9FUNG|nr:hypothetical protein BGZ96_002556 [Linnemannia gamsii]
MASQSMQVLLNLLALIVSKGPESFIPSYSDDFAMFVQPHGKSYQDLINLLPKLSRELMTKITIATRHWVRYEEVEVIGRRRRHSIESCSRDDLSLSGFGDLTSQEMPSLLDPNRECLQNLANALFSNSKITTQISFHTSWYHGGARKKYMADYRVQLSTEENLQSISSNEVEIGDKEAMEALENLMLLHECVDQLESWKKFSDEHAALPLPPWRTNVTKGEGSNLVHYKKKAVLVRRSSDKYSVSRTSRPEGRVGAQPQPHDLSALIPPVPSRNSYLGLPELGVLTPTKHELSTDDQYNFKTSYWQFKHRQDRTRQDNSPSACPPRRVNRIVKGAVPHSRAAQPLDTESETMSSVDETCLSATLNFDSFDSSAHSSQKSIPATTAQLALPEFVAPPMKDLYSAPIIMHHNHLPPQLQSLALVGSTTPSATSKKYVTATIDTNAIKAAAKRRPPPFALRTPSSPTTLSKSMATISLSPTTAESFITKISSRTLVDQEVEVFHAAKKGWHLWKKPLQHWKRKSVPVVQNTVSPPRQDMSLPPVPSKVDLTDLSPSSPRTSSPITIITAAVTSKQSSVAAAATAAEAFPGATKPWMRPGFVSKSQKPSDNSPLKSPKPNLNIITHQSTNGGLASLPSSMSFSSQDGSFKTAPSPGLGCSIESISFPEDYLSTVLSPSSSTSALWSAPPLIPTPTLQNGSSPRMDAFPMVTSISPLPSPSFSRKKRLQDKLFGKKSKLPLEDASSPTYPYSVSTLPPQNKLTLFQGGVTGSTGGDGPELRSSSSFGSLREKKSFGQLIVPLVLAPLEQRGILKTRSRSSSITSMTAVGAAAAASPIRCLDPGTPPPPSSPFAYPTRHCYEPQSDHDHHSHQRPPFERATSQPISLTASPLLSSESPSPFPSSALQPKSNIHMPAKHRYHNKVPVGSVIVAGGGGGQYGSVSYSSDLGKVSSTSRDEKEANAQIWKVLDQWGAWRDAHSPSK